MSETTKTVLIVGGVAVGAYVLLGLLKPAGATVRQPAPTDYGFFSGLINVGLAAAQAFGPGSGSSNASPVYVIGQGYVQGGGNAPIDPSTGGVFLPTGETYGPRLPA
jgi:hypothetical protein